MNVMSLIIPYFPPPLFVLQRVKHLKPSRLGPQTQNFVKQFHATNTLGVVRICCDHGIRFLRCGGQRHIEPSLISYTRK